MTGDRGLLCIDLSAPQVFAGRSLMRAGRVRQIEERHFRQDLPADIERIVSSGVEDPFDQNCGVSLKLYAGDAQGMDAASRVHITGCLWIQSGAVGVTGCQGDPVLRGIVREPLFHTVFSGVVLCSAGGIQNPKALQGLPQVAHQKARHRPCCRVPKVGLMTMGQVKAVIVGAVFQNQSFVKDQIREQFLTALCISTEISFKDPAGVAGLFLFHIMISIEQIEPFLFVEEGKKPEYIIVYFDDLAHLSVFPQFIPVTQFYIGEPVGIIVFQCREIQVLVFQEVIIGTAIPPMAVADQAIAAAVVQGEDRGILKGVSETGGVAHSRITPFSRRSILRRAEGSR